MNTIVIASPSAETANGLWRWDIFTSSLSELRIYLRQTRGDKRWFLMSFVRMKCERIFYFLTFSVFLLLFLLFNWLGLWNFENLLVYISQIKLCGLYQTRFSRGTKWHHETENAAPLHSFIAHFREKKGFYLLGPFLCSLWQIFVDYGSTHQIWQHIAKGRTQARALQTTGKKHHHIMCI